MSDFEIAMILSLSIILVGVIVGIVLIRIFLPNQEITKEEARIDEEEVIEFVGEKIPKSIFNKWNMTTGENRPRIKRHGEFYEPCLVPENDNYYCGQGDLRWAWCPVEEE